MWCQTNVYTNFGLWVIEKHDIAFVICSMFWVPGYYILPMSVLNKEVAVVMIKMDFLTLDQPQPDK